MLTTRNLLLLIAALGLLACNPDLRGGTPDDDDDTDDDDDDDGTDDDDDDDDDDDETTDPVAVLLSVFPDQDAFDVPVSTEFRLEFDRPPGAVEWRVVSAAGEAVDFEISVSTDENDYVGEPTSALEAGEAYRVLVAWGPNEIGYEFTTLEAADVDEMEAVIGAVYVSSLLDGEFTEPAGAGGIIQANLDDIPLMLSVRPETDFAFGAQPGFHVIGAIGHFNDAGLVEQDPCGASIAMTAGPDEAYGTGDDDPGIFSAGSFLLGPTQFAVSTQGTALDLREVELSGSFLPSLDSIVAMSLGAVADTRPLDGLLGDGEEGAICTLLEDTVGVECFECGEPRPGAFCMNVVIEQLVAAIQVGLVLQERTCADVITLWESGGTCHPEALTYDADGDGTYELCPAYAE